MSMFMLCTNENRYGHTHGHGQRHGHRRDNLKLKIQKSSVSKRFNQVFDVMSDSAFFCPISGSYMRLSLTLFIMDIGLRAYQ
jgi:hypothetical protein